MCWTELANTHRMLPGDRKAYEALYIFVYGMDMRSRYSCSKTEVVLFPE